MSTIKFFPASFLLFIVLGLLLNGAALAAPTVTGIVPATGSVAGGMTVTLTGTEFTGATSVTIGGTPATGLTVINATTITCVTPFHAAGAVSVFVTATTGTNPANTLYTYVPYTVSSGPALSTPRFNHSTTLLPNGKVLVVGGANGPTILATAQVYDPATGAWSTTGSLTTARAQHTATLLPNGKVLIVAGRDSTNTAIGTAELYSPDTGTWSATGSLSAPRYGATATRLGNGKVLLAVGRSVTNALLATAELYDPASGTWSGTGSLTTARQGASANLLPNGKVLVAGGVGGSSTTCELYDPSVGTWSVTGSLSASRVSHSAALLPSGKVIAVAGTTGAAALATAEIYDPATGVWTATGSLTTARYFHALSLLPNGKLLVMGGTSATNTFNNSVELYDPATGTWVAAGTLVTARSQLSATLLANGKVLLVAGLGLGPTGQTAVEVIEPNATTMTSAASMTGVRLAHTTTVLMNGKVLVAGGTNGASAIAGSELYDPVAGIWSNTGSLAAARQNHTATLLSNGKVLVAAGGGPLRNSAELYDPATGTWSAAASLTTARQAHSATLLPSGRVLVVGGSNGSPLATAELYDPLANTWSAAASLTTARSAHSATLLPNGKVLVVGGNGGISSSTIIATAELYDPASNTWSSANPITTACMNHTATLLPNGRVLVAGGQTNGVLAVSSTQIYDPATGNWNATGSLAAARYTATATLLTNGKVLVAGGTNGTTSLSSTELYDPATGVWTGAPALTALRQWLGAALMPNGNVLFTGGGSSFSVPFGSVDLFDVGLGFTAATQPLISTATVNTGSALVLSGSRFRGIASGSGGALPMDSATNHPLVLLRRLDNEQSTFVLQNPSVLTTDTAFTSISMAGQPLGPCMVTVFANGIPSTGTFVQMLPPLPTVSVISPSVGGIAGFTNVTITGTNFVSGARVTIGGSTATSVVVVNDTTITCATPAHAAGVVSVEVTTLAGTSAANSLYTYTAAPSVSSVSPNSGSTLGGQNVTVTGMNFNDATAVIFGGTGATNINVVNSTTITCTTPAHAAGNVGVQVTTPVSTSLPSFSYTYVTPPTVTAITPGVGTHLGGTSVTITGTNFINLNTTVTIGGAAAASVNVTSPTTLTCTTPAGTPGPANVQVTTAGGSTAANTLFTYFGPPTVTAISPSSGSTLGGTGVTITGTNFTLATSVTLGGTSATGMTVVNDTTITCTTGARAAGTVSVQVNSPSGTNAVNSLFTYAVSPYATAAPLSTARHLHTTTLLPDGRVLVVGGSNNAAALTLAQIYNPATGTWSDSSALVTARMSHTATLLPNGKVLVAGGRDGVGVSIAGAVLYDLDTGLWSSTGSLATARHGHSATLLPNGKVLVVGGSNGSALSSAEVYDPTTGAWSSAGTLYTSRQGATATLLSNGKVLVAGGGNNSSEIYDPQSGAWTLTGLLSTTRAYHTATLLPNGKVMLVGGANGNSAFTSAELYDPVTGIWAATASMSTARYNHTATLLPNGRLLVAGGATTVSSYTNTVEAYDPATGTWSSIGDLITSRGQHGATLLASGRMLVVAGTGSSGSLAAVEIYEPVVASMTAAASMTTARESHAGTLLANGKMLVAGGHNGSSFLNTAVLYDLAAGTWSATGSLGTARRNHTVTLLPDGKVLVVAGNTTGAVALSSAELYDPSAGTWSSAGTLSAARYYHATALLPNGKVLVVGGSNGSSTLASAELYDPLTNTWSGAGALTTSRYAHTLTLLPNGKVLVVGGNSGSSNYLASAELYDPATNTWSGTGAITAARMYHTATLLPNGKVLVAGGLTGAATASSQLYDPVAGTWSATGSLAAARYYHTATLLPNGKVLVAGGYNPNNSLASVELYDPATGAWSSTTALTTLRSRHFATLLPNGKVLISGGVISAANPTTSVELYEAGLGFNAAWQPLIGSATFNSSSSLVLSGTRFRGISSASGGNGSMDSASNSPVVQVRRLDNEQSLYLRSHPGTNTSDTNVTTVSMTGLPYGHYMVTVIANSIPSAGSLVRHGQPPPSVITVDPPVGSVAGGTRVTITGTTLTGATNVTFDGTPAANVVVVNDTSITCTTPAHIAGSVSVNVTTPNGVSPAKALYTYLGASTWTGTSPYITTSGVFNCADLEFGAELGFVPTPPFGPLVFIHADVGIIGRFKDLPDGGVVAMALNGVIYYFQADYDTNDITLTPIAPSDPPAWKWVSGPSYRNGVGIYGNLGVASASSNPGARQGAMNWLAQDGSLWMFGGYGYASVVTSPPRYLNDLWQYDRVIGQWVWRGGNDTPNNYGVYGVRGVEAAGSAPGSRHTGTTWTDGNGDLWLFGGFGVGTTSGAGALNDLWRFNMVTRRWTWMKGGDVINSPAAYGMQGNAAEGNTPGARSSATGFYLDGSLWLFGGCNGTNVYNDIWRYDIASGNWTWVDGSSTPNQNGVYGILGVPGASNTPGSRRDATGWVSQNGMLWLFGGLGLAASGSTNGDLSDLWRYNPASGEWTWIKGANTAGADGVYGTIHTPAAGNLPGARSAGSGWCTVDGKFWLVGGFKNSSLAFNDVWIFDPLTGEWTWKQGGAGTLSVSGVYGMRGVAAPGNQPGGRFTPSTWVTLNGTLWIFGGGGADSLGNTGRMSDLWSHGIPNPQGSPYDNDVPADFPDTFLVNAAPSTTNTTAGTTAYMPVSGQLNGTDADGDRIYFQAVGTTSVYQGTLNLQVDGTWTYVPAYGFTGVVGFQFKVADDYGGQSGVRSLVITISSNAADSDGDGIGDAYEREVWGDIVSADAEGDADLDGQSNYFEFVAQTDPLNGGERLLTAPAVNSQGAVLHLNHVRPGVNYHLETSGDLQDWLHIGTFQFDRAGSATINPVTDGNRSVFYRVRLEATTAIIVP